MARTIAIGDIHGCHNALTVLLRAIEPAPDDTLVFLGDYVDRGPNSREVVDELLRLRQTCNVVALRGNHELMLIAARVCRVPPAPWLMCGGGATLASYGERLERLPAAHLGFLGSLRSYHETSSAIFVHAGYVHDLEMHDQPDHALYWDHLDSAAPPLPHVSGKTVFVGHTPQLCGRPRDLGHLVCLDTYCCGGRWLTAMDVDSRETWQASQRGYLRREPFKTLGRCFQSCRQRWKRA